MHKPLTLADEPVTIALSECVCPECHRVVPKRYENGGPGIGEIILPMPHEDASGERCGPGEQQKAIDPWRYPR